MGPVTSLAMALVWVELGLPLDVGATLHSFAGGLIESIADYRPERRTQHRHVEVAGGAARALCDET
jgi:hypothetical protein